MELEVLWGTGNQSWDANGTLNGTLNDTYRGCGSDSLPVEVAVLQALYALVCAVGLPFNFLVIYVVLWHSNMQSATNIYIVNLAIADVCFLIDIPVLVATMSWRGWYFGAAMCKVYMISTGINQFTSSALLGIMSADRYVAVCHPIAAMRLRTPTVSWFVAVATWSVSALIMAPIFIYARIIPNNGPTCSILWPKHDFHMGQTFMLYSFVLGFATPLTLIFVFYCLVIRRLRTVGPKHRSEAMKRSQRKVTIMVLAVVVAYLLCWLPYWAFQLALVFSPPTECASRINVTVFLVATCLTYSNSAINPVLYAFLTENFKKSFLKACTCAATGNDVNVTLRMRTLGRAHAGVPRRDELGAA